MQLTLNSNGETPVLDFQGLATIQVSGTFGGATVTPYVSLDGGVNYIVPTDASGDPLAFTESTATNLECAKAKLKFAMTDADSSSVLVDVVNFRDQS